MIPAQLIVMTLALFIEQLGHGVAIDWKERTIEAAGSCAADMRAPSVEVMRIKAERVARERARARIADALSGLPRSRWRGAPPSREEILKATGEAELVHVDYGATGSVSLRLRLGLHGSTLSRLLPRKHRG